MLVDLVKMSIFWKFILITLQLDLGWVHFRNPYWYVDHGAWWCGVS